MIKLTLLFLTIITLLFMLGCTTSDKVCKTVCIPGEECQQKCKTYQEWGELNGY
jgi:hypothetical protein